jgi:hypothetical protein
LTAPVDALEWVREQGIVLASARGPVPNLAEFVAGEPIRGSWWGHPEGHRIYAALTEVDESPDVVRTRLINGKVTLIHHRMWPALSRAAERFPPAGLDAIDQVHTASGAHRNVVTPFPSWVPAEDLATASALSLDAALASLPRCLRE